MKTCFHWFKREALRRKKVVFQGSTEYWRNRYRTGGDSGAGSYGVLAQYKADILNKYVADKSISTVIDIGCGDGNNIGLMNFPYYLGVDISELIIKRNRKYFDWNLDWTFLSFDSDLKFTFKADLCISLDVIYHLVEDEVFENYMNALMNSSSKYVAIYSSNFSSKYEFSHVLHRKFSDWIQDNRPEFQLTESIPNPYEYDPKNGNPDTTSASFYFYELQDSLLKKLRGITEE